MTTIKKDESQIEPSSSTQNSEAPAEESQTFTQMMSQLQQEQLEEETCNLESETPSVQETQEAVRDLFTISDTREAFFLQIGIPDTSQSRKEFYDNCKKKKDKVYKIHNDKILELLIRVFAIMCRYAKHGKSYAHNFNSNLNESFNNVITRYAPKRLDLPKTYQMKVNQAVLRFNYGNDDWKLKVISMLGFEVSQTQAQKLQKTNQKDKFHRVRKQKQTTKNRRAQLKKDRQNKSKEKSKKKTKMRYKSKKEKKDGELFTESNEKPKRKAPTCKSCGFPIKGGKHDAKCPKFKESNQKKRKRQDEDCSISKKRKIMNDSSEIACDDDILDFDPFRKSKLVIKTFGGTKKTIKRLMELDAMSPEY